MVRRQLEEGGKRVEEGQEPFSGTSRASSPVFLPADGDVKLRIAKDLSKAPRDVNGILSSSLCFICRSPHFAVTLTTLTADWRT